MYSVKGQKVISIGQQAFFDNRQIHHHKRMLTCMTMIVEARGSTLREIAHFFPPVPHNERAILSLFSLKEAFLRVWGCQTDTHVWTSSSALCICVCVSGMH